MTIQQVTAVSSVVNGGILYKPYIVGSVTESSTDSIIIKNNPLKIRNTISESTSSIMRYALESVVARGGGRYAYVEGYRVGGKTGTAQKVKDGRYMDNNFIMSFMAIVPSNDPKAVLYVAIDNPKKTALLSSYTTAPVARRILLDIISSLNIPTQSGSIEKIRYWDDPIYYDLPNVIGLTKKEAQKALYNYTIEYTGYGDYVVEMSPNAGTRLEMGSVVRLLLGDKN